MSNTRALIYSVILFFSMGESDEDDVRPTDSLLQRSAPEYKMPKKDKDKEKTPVSERWHVVAFCALTACIASMVAGMSLSFSSIIINELNTSMSVRKQWRIEASGVEASLIGVRPVHYYYSGTS